jgi:LPPG:FO 2-phospho-L-lactate transferase
VSAPRVVYLSGGVGGARLAHGLGAALDAESLRIVVNTGDDFEHLGLHISPDLDTVMYTLADLAHPARGWGLETESFEALAMLQRYGAPGWFALGDRDLATHLARSDGLRSGQTLTAVTERLRSALGVAPALLSMSDGPCPFRIETRSHGIVPFQHWLVQSRGELPVHAVHLSRSAPATNGVLAALDWAELIVIGPSNPYVSIDPILALAGVRERVARRPVVAVSPLVHGAAIKGPLAQMIPALAARPADSAAIAAHYGTLLSLLVVEPGDEPEVREVPVLATNVRITGRAASRRLAGEILDWYRGRS